MKFTDLAFNPMSRMNEVYRYSSVYQETNERLSDHITEVSIMSYLIAKELESSYHEELNLGVLLEKCLLHDIDEVLTGDIPRNTKYATNQVHTELNKVADQAVDTIVRMMPSTSDLKSIWSSAKDGKEGTILAIVDMLCVAKKCITEVELRGNLTFLKVITELEGHLSRMLQKDILRSEFSSDASLYLAQLIKDAKDEITTIRVNYRHLIDKYHIKENVIEGDD